MSEEGIHPDTDGLIKLAAGVIRQAAQDYQVAKKMLDDNPPNTREHILAERACEEITRFTKSKLFHSIIDMETEEFLDLAERKEIAMGYLV